MPMKRIAALLIVLMFLPLTALADIIWPDQTAGQMMLKTYVELVNENLVRAGQNPVNALFECYPTFAAMGIVSSEDVTIPEDVELTFVLTEGSISSLQLRVSDPSRFAAIAGSCLQAVSPDAITLEAAMTEPAAYAQKAIDTPTDSFEDTVIELNGEFPRAYYAYYPNQYHDGISWLQLTLIFPLAGLQGSAVAVTPPPEDDKHSYYESDEYDGYEYDGGTHLEIFTTSTPEPDSAAME